MTSKLEFLDQLPIFEYLSDEELAALASLAVEYEFDEGAVIAYQRDVADALYIVCGGHLFAKSVDEAGRVIHTRTYEKGDYFDEVWLFTPQAHPATVKAVTSGRLLVIKTSDFMAFLRRFPRALQRLAPEYDESGHRLGGLSTEAWQEAQKVQIAPVAREYKVGELTTDELVEFATRRSQLLLVLKVVPLVFFFFLLLGAFLYLSQIMPLLRNRIVVLVVPVGLVVLFFALIIYQWLDWRNDYFVITNKQLMHHEFDLSLGKFGTTVTRTPIDQVQSVEVEKPNVLYNLLDVGTARVTTAAQSGVIYFDFINDPGAVRDTITRIQQRVRDLDAGREQAVMRQTLEEHFNANTAYREIEDEHMSQQDKTEESFLGGLRRRYGARVVVGNTITYRKHVFVLMSQSRWPTVLALALIIAAFVLVRVFQFTLWTLLPFLLVAAFADFIWLVWRVEDWRNDSFQLTDRYVIDIDRSPFGTGESRKQAELKNVQNISSDRPGLLPTLFNFGNVYIETAGASANITFENVVNPNRIQRDIFQRRERLRRDRRLKEGVQRRKEYALLLDVYRQAEEQGRIPRRTPPSEGSYQE